MKPNVIMIVTFCLFMMSGTLRAVSGWDGSYPPSATSLIQSNDISVSGSIYKIYTAKGLAWLSQATVNAEMKDAPSGVNAQFAGCEVYLMNDLDLAGFEWNPIGTAQKPFKGIFRGNNFRIQNLVIKRTLNETQDIGIGLFGAIENAQISEIGIESGAIRVIYETNSKPLPQINVYAGALIGLMVNSTIINCHIIMSNVEAKGPYLTSSGGLVGKLGSGKILNSYADVDKLGTGFSPYEGVSTQMDYCGGIVGNAPSHKDIVLRNNIAMIDSIYAVSDNYYGILGFSNLDAFNIFNCHSFIKNPGKNGNTLYYDNTKEFIDRKVLSKITLYSYFLSDYIIDLLNQEVGSINSTAQKGYPDAQYWLEDVYCTTGMPNLSGTLTYWSRNINDLKEGIDYDKKGEWYEIHTAKGLALLAASCNNPASVAENIRIPANASVRLTQDIDLQGQYWEPIGQEGAAFSGQFDGQNFKISNLHVYLEDQNSSTACYGGLFGITQNAILTNVGLSKSVELHIRGLNRSVTKQYLGALVGMADHTLIYNSYVQSSFQISTNYLPDGEKTLNSGGLVGFLSNNSGVYNSYVDVEQTITGNFTLKNAGYLLGYLSANSAIEGCHFRKKTVSDTPASGVGATESGDMTDIKIYVRTTSELKSEKFLRSLTEEAILANNKLVTVNPFAGLKTWEKDPTSQFPVLSAEAAPIRKVVITPELLERTDATAILSLAQTISFEGMAGLTSVQKEILGTSLANNLKAIDMQPITTNGISSGKLFENCTNLLVIQAVDGEMWKNEFGAQTNENCIILCSDPTKTPATGITNIIYKQATGSYTADHIDLTDKSPFLFPVDFTAKEITYTRSFGPASATVGWETIWLPYAPAQILANGKEIRSFDKSDPNTGDFWLREFSGSTSGSVDFSNTGTFQANTPYIIAIPGSYWGEAFNLAQYPISFVGRDCAILQSHTNTPNQATTDYSFVGCYLTEQDYLDAPERFVLFTESNRNVFMKKEGSQILPFHAYFKNAETMSPVNTRALRITYQAGSTTDLHLSKQANDTDADIFSSGNELVCLTNQDKVISIYRYDGMLLLKHRVQPGENRITLPAGVYLVEGKKICITL